MALPKLNDTPKYELVIPSTQEKVRYRPYLVKEEKVLMLAAESGDAKASMTAVIDTIKACILEDIKFADLTTFDIEYAFIQIRSKSVGENSIINAKCEHCEEPNEVSIPLDEINVTTSNIDLEVKLTDTVGIKLKWPRYLDVVNADLDEMSTTEQTFRLLVECIDEVITEDEVIKFSNEKMADRAAFIESLDSKQFKILREFAENMPSVSHQVKFVCSACNKDNDFQLKGMQDFL